MKWYLKCFIVILLLCCACWVPAVQAESNMPLIVSDLNFSQRADGACYQNGANKLFVELYTPQSQDWEALLVFTVKNADTGALLTVNAKSGSIPDGTTDCELSFEIPDGIDVARTRGTLLVLNADTLQPLAAAHTIDSRQQYPYISTPQKTHLLQTLTGTVTAPGTNTVTVQTATESVTLPVTPEVAASLSRYEGKTCDCFIDIDTNGQKTISAISLQTITVHRDYIVSIRDEEICYRDTEGEQQYIPLDQTPAVYRNNLSIPVIDIFYAIYLGNLDTRDIYYDLADTDGNGQVDLINIHRTDHAAVVGVDGTTVHTANMGMLDLSQTILTDKAGAAVPLSQLRAGDVLAITWHPGKFRTPYQAVVLPASYVDGTVTETNLSYYFAAIDGVGYNYFIPNSSYPYSFPLSIADEGRFYLDQYGNIFAVSVQDSFQPYDWLQSVRWENDYRTELTIQTSSHGIYRLSETDALQLQDNTGKITVATPLDTLSANDFSSTTFEQLFDGQETLPVYALLGNLPTVTETAAADDLFTHAVGASYDYTTNRLTLSPLPMNEKTALQNALFHKTDMTLICGRESLTYALAPDALLMRAVLQHNQVRVQLVTAEQIPDGAYDMLLYGKDDTGRYRAAIFMQYTQSFQWQQTQPAIIEQISQMANDELRVQVYTNHDSKALTFTKDSVNADTGEAAGRTNLAVGDVILYLASGNTVRQYRTLGKAEQSEYPHLTPTNVLDTMDIPGIQCLCGYAKENDGETLTVIAGTETVSIAVPADFAVTRADYINLSQYEVDICQTNINAITPLDLTLPMETPSATPVMAYLRDGALVDLIAFSPDQTFVYNWETRPMSIVTRVFESLDSSGNPVRKVYAVQDGISDEAVYRLSGSSINADTGKATAMTEDFRQGDVVLFHADSAGNVSKYRIVGSPATIGDVPFVLEPAFAAENPNRYSDQYRLGYIQEIHGSMIDLYFPNATQRKEESYYLRGANEYRYNDVNANNIRIEVGYFESGEVDETYDGKCSYVLVHLRDDEVVDIYSFNRRCPIPEA